MSGICQFIDSVSPTEERYRWGKIFCLQLLIICFLNSYGYDFQKTNQEQIKEIILFAKLHKDGSLILSGFEESLKKYMLDTNSEISTLIESINA